MTLLFWLLCGAGLFGAMLAAFCAGFICGRADRADEADLEFFGSRL